MHRRLHSFSSVFFGLEEMARLENMTTTTTTTTNADPQHCRVGYEFLGPQFPRCNALGQEL